ncbi:MAG: hypothetical protein ACI97A_002271 [Planctomycetota bacterium]
MIDQATRSKREALSLHIRSLPSLVVAFSGGVDSSLLVAVAAQETTTPLLAVTGVSASLSEHQLEQAKRVAAHLGIEHRLLPTGELDNPNYAANPKNRCFFCKEELFLQIRAHVGNDWPHVADGNNLDDCQDFRPGRQAGREAGILSPFIEAQLTKADIRQWSRELNLETAELPASPCLSSRLQTGTPVTVSSLARIELAEHEMRKLGFVNFRVRDLGGAARLEVAEEEHSLLNSLSVRDSALGLLRFVGFEEARIDERPLRSGRLHSEQGSAEQPS